MVEEVKHYQIGTKYKMQLERSAVKGIDGFKVEANGDELEDVKIEAQKLYVYAIGLTKPELLA